MTKPYHVRIAISQYGDHFRAELFTEDLGDTDGDLISADRPILDVHWSDFLVGGGSLSSDNARSIGKELFAKLLGGTENAAKWQQILQRAERESRPIRILIDASTDDVRNLPFGLLCDSLHNAYLFRPRKGKPDIRFVRIIRRCTPRPINLKQKPLRMLLAVAEPAVANLRFDASARLLEMGQGLEDTFEISLCTQDKSLTLHDAIPYPKDEWEATHFEPFVRTSRVALRSALERGNFDVLHLIAHGQSGDAFLLCDSSGQTDPATAGDLGEWCRGNLQLAFLQACKASYTGDQGGFGGVAQQLLNPEYGDLAAVVASPYPIDAEKATSATLDFYKDLVGGHDLDEAINRNRPELDFIWAFLEVWVRPRALGQTGTRGAFQFVSPYRGLARFEERDADIFFGRETETAELIKLLRDEPIVAVVGDSGSGKSSLLRAGLAPKIRRNGLLDHAHWQIVTLTPGHHPVESLLAALNNVDEASPSSNSLLVALHTACSPEKPLLLLFDQFEEVLTVCKNTHEREALTVALGEAANQLRAYFRVVLAMRSDYLGRIASLPGIAQSLSRPWLLRSPTNEQFQNIIEKPALHYGYQFEGSLDDKYPEHGNSLLDRLLQDPLLIAESNGRQEDMTDHSISPLPLLEFALERLWLRALERDSFMFTRYDYDELGGLSGAIATHAEEVYQELALRTDLGDAPQEMMERILVGLVSARKTSRPRRRSDLETESENAEQAQWMIDHLVGERLLTLRVSRVHRGEPEVEVAHEILISKWDRLKKWLEQDTETRAFIQEFQEDAEQWDFGTSSLRDPRRPENLPSIERANRYLDGLERLRIPLTTTQQAFAQELATMRAKDAEEKEQLRAALEQASSRAIQICVRNGTEAIKDGYLWGAWVWFAEALKLESQRNGSEESHRIRLASVQRQLPEFRYVWFHDIPAEHISFSPCGTRMLTYHSRNDNRICLWNCQNRSLVAELSVPGIRANQLAFSTDGSRVLANIYHQDGNTNIIQSYFQTWLNSSGEPDIAVEIDDDTEIVAFDPSGQWVLACDAQTKFQIWEVASQKPIWDPWLAEIRPREYGNNVILDRPRQRVFLIADENIWIWDLADVISTRTVELEKRIEHVKYAFESGYLIVATYDDTVMILNPNEPDLPRTVLASDGKLEGIDASPNGELVLTTVKLKSDNMESRVWSISTGTAQGKPLLHEAAIERWEFEPSRGSLETGTMLASATFFGVSRVKPFARNAGFSPDGRHVFTISEIKKSARIWDWRLGKAISPPISHLFDAIESVAYSADGCSLATAANDGTIRIWDVVVPHGESLPLERYKLPDDVSFGPIEDWAEVGRPLVQDKLSDRDINYSSDGQFYLGVTKIGVYVGSTDKEQPSPLFDALKHTDQIKYAMFSPDSKEIWTYSGTEFRQWGSRTGTLLKSPTKNKGYLRTFKAASKDGRYVAMSSRDESLLQIISVYDGEPVTPQMEHPGKVDSVLFSENGRRLVASYRDEVFIWDASFGELLSPSIRHRAPIQLIGISRNSEKLAVVTGQRSSDKDAVVHIWDLDKDTAAVDSLLLYGEVSSQHRIDTAGGYVPLEVEQYRRTWINLLEQHPEILTSSGRDIVWHQQQYEKADDFAKKFHLDQLIKKLPNEPWPLAMRADYLRKKGMYSEALADYTRAIELAPHDPQLYKDRGSTFLSLNEWKYAVEDLSKSHVSSDPQQGYQRALIDVATHMRHKKMHAEAIEYYSEAIELGEVFPEAFWGRGQIYREMGEWQAAAEDLLFGLNEKDTSGGYLCSIVTCKAQDPSRYQQLCQRMIQQLDRILQIEDAIERWNNTLHIAWTCILGANATEDWDVIRSCLSGYVGQEKPPDTKIPSNAKLLLGAVLYRSGDFDAAVDYLEQSAIHPYDWLFLAMTHYRLGDKTKSTYYFNQAHDLLNQTIRSENANQRSSWDWREQASCEILELEAQQLLEANHD